MLIVAGVIKIDPAKRSFAEEAFANVRAATLKERRDITTSAPNPDRYPVTGKASATWAPSTRTATST